MHPELFKSYIIIKDNKIIYVNTNHEKEQINKEGLT